QQGSLAENPDWKAIVRLVNNSKREWSKNRVADRKPDKALEQRFSDALKAYEEALSVQYVENFEAKQALVAKVAELAGGEITQHSANQAKSLLSAWKLVGIMRRKEDQALWEVFNGHLGTIFKHQHQVEREKQRAGLEHVFRAKDIVKRLKQLSKGDSLEESEVQGLSAEFQALAEFPERDKKFLLRDFRQVMEACSRVQESASRRRNDAEFEERRRLVGLCEQLEAAMQQSGAQTSNLTEDISHAWETSDVRVVPEIASLLQKRRDAALEHLSKGTHPDYAANESARRDLVIRMEIAAGLDTPTEDKPRRMQYQLQNLQAGMTSAGVNDSKLVLQQLEIEWIAAGPSSQAVSGSLHSRFLKAYRR
ncbi:MAG: exonuclease SbcC, partial [Porticoccaceae bacterium]